jgi:hypothetical protein
MKVNTRSYTDDEAIRRVWDVLEIKNLMGRHAYYHAYDMHGEELDTLWVAEPENRKTASFGQNFGYQIGFYRIHHYYVTINRQMRQKELELMIAADPSIENTPENAGRGMMLIHTLTTPYIEVAGDGMTAQGLWYSPGQVTVAKPDGSVDRMWMYEKYGVDFIRESGDWKIWHLFVGTDFALEPGSFMKDQPVPDVKKREESWQEMSIAMDAYSSRYNWTAYPRIPTPYQSYDPAFGNGPEGNPDFGKGDV